MVSGSIEGVGVPAVVVAPHIPVIHGDPKGYILVLGSICHGGFSGSFRRQHLAPKGQEAQTQGPGRQMGRRSQMAILFLSSPFGQLRNHHIAVPDPAPDDFIDFIHH